MKAKEAKMFSYTANREEFMGLAIGFSLVIVAEAIGLDLAIAFLVEGGLKWLLLGLIVGTHVYMVCWLFAPLYTKHRLSSSFLYLHYGWSFKKPIPLEVIAGATAWKKPLKTGETLFPRYVAERQRLILNFSPTGQVLLTLKQELSLKLGFMKVEVREILLNVDNRAEFLAALNLPSSLETAETTKI
jgi:hypothetical protein